MCRKKTGPPVKRCEQMPSQFDNQRVFSKPAPEIEKNTGLKEIFGLGGVNPIFEVGLPLAEGFTPFWIFGHDPTRTKIVAGLVQQGAGDVTELSEIAVYGISSSRLRILVNDGVVLIGFQGLFPSPPHCP